MRGPAARTRPVLALLTAAALVVPLVASARPPHTVDLAARMRNQAPTETAPMLEALAQEIEASRMEPDALISATNRILRTLSGIRGPDSDEFVESAFRDVAETAGAYLTEAEIEHEIEFKPAHKCNRNLDCAWSTTICIRFTWTGPDGSGGVNCYTYSPL